MASSAVACALRPWFLASTPVARRMECLGARLIARIGTP
jgi:hypothetical protein